ncbi:MAG: sigma-70 family RNA polymerase sigma factor [Gemmatimonadota bacterium]
MNQTRVRTTEVEARQLTDSELVEGYLGGEGACFRELVGRYEGRIVNFIQRSIGDRERAYDLAQETFIRVYRHIHRFDTSKKFSTWIYTIASNLAKNELRNRSRNPLVLFQTLTSKWDDDHRPLQFEDSSMRPDDLFRQRQLQDLVERAAEQLPEHHREVFILREIEGKSYEEIAEITDTQLGTVKSRLNRARNRFAQIIEPWLE